MTIHKIRKGFDVRLAGKAELTLENAPEPVFAAVMPTEFPGIKPKLMVQEGDQVRTGQPLFRDKRRDGLHFASPATGKVHKVELGPRRFPQRIEITLAEEDRFADDLPRIDPAAIDSTSREDLIAALLACGLWPTIRQRPVGRLADPGRTPAAIFVNGMDTEPLAADPVFATQGEAEAFQTGIRALRRLTDGKVYLSLKAFGDGGVLRGVDGVEVHEFDGPHPAGLVGTHIRFIQPLHADQVAWFLKAQEVVQIGRWLLDGHYPTHRVIALAGTGAPQRRYFRIRNGAALLTLTGGAPLEGDWRIISGTALNGEAVDPLGAVGFYAYTVTIMPEGTDRRDLFGWALPQLGKHSASRAVAGGAFPKAEYDLDARMHGGERPIVNIGTWERMTPLDIHPTYLLRAIQAGDLEEAIHLGLLEVTEEDVALCTFADPCKIDAGVIIRQGLELYEKEG